MVEIPRLDSPESLPTQRVQGPTLPLSPREREVLVLSAKGLTRVEIGEELSRTTGTIKNYVTTINYKLLEKSAHDSAVRALITGEIGLEEVSPDWNEPNFLNHLTAAERKAWTIRAQRAGTRYNIAHFLGKADGSIQNLLGSIREKLGVLSTDEASVLYYAHNPELLRPQIIPEV